MSQEAERPSDELVRIINSEQLAFIIPCGGTAKRLHRNIKAFEQLPECVDETEPPEYQGGAYRSDADATSIARTPLGMVLRDIPKACRVYLHTNRRLENTFSRDLDAVNWYGHKHSIILHHEKKAFKFMGSKLEEAFLEDGSCINAVAGPAAISYCFGSRGYPEYFAFVDGCLLGMYFQDFADALDILLKDESIDIVAFAQRLSQEQIENDLTSKKKRFARINQEAQRVYDNEEGYVFLDGQKPGEIPEDVIKDKKWLGLLGMYVTRAERFLEVTQGLKGMLLSMESSNSVHDNLLAYHLKMSMTLRGYAGRQEGLRFGVYEPKWFIPAIKSDADIQMIPQWVKDGKLDYRKLNRIEL
jgi:hypothetical protein